MFTWQIVIFLALGFRLICSPFNNPFFRSRPRTVGPQSVGRNVVGGWQ